MKEDSLLRVFVVSWLHVIVQELGAVRAAGAFDWTRLATYLRERMPDYGDVTRGVEVSQFRGGRSNLTYLLRIGERELVLRRPPPGPLPPRAHDIAREYRWLSALQPLFPLAPRPYLLCDDPAVAGSIFYLMERRRGVVVRDGEPPGLAGHPEVRRRVSDALVDTLVALHAIDARALGSLGKPSGFVERQVRGWSERWQRAKTSSLLEMEAIAAWLCAHLPPEPAAPAIVHGDFKLDNVMIGADDPGRIVAVFDWEMSALGDPLIDLGILLAYWGPTSPPGTHGAADVVTIRPGWLTREELLHRYSARSGRDVSRIGFYEIFALFKVAVVIQQLYSRYVAGQTDDPRYATFDVRVAYLAREAVARVPALRG